MYFAIVLTVTSDIIQSTSQSNFPSMTATIQSVNIAVSTSTSQSVNITTTEGTANGYDSSATMVSIVASVVGSLLGLCIVGICITAVMIKKCRSRRKLKHLQFSAVSL